MVEVLQALQLAVPLLLVRWVVSRDVAVDVAVCIKAWATGAGSSI